MSLSPAIQPTPHSVDFDFYTRRPDLWAIAASLRHSPAYRKGIWDLLSNEDQEALRAHKHLYQTAVELAEQAKQPQKRVAV